MADACQRAYRAASAETVRPAHISQDQMFAALCVTFFPGATRQYCLPGNPLDDMFKYYGKLENHRVRPAEQYAEPPFVFLYYALSARYCARIRFKYQIEMEVLTGNLHLPSANKLKELGPLWENKPTVPSWWQSFGWSRVPYLTGDVTHDLHCFAARSHVLAYLCSVACLLERVVQELFLDTHGQYVESAVLIAGHAVQVCETVWRVVFAQPEDSSLEQALTNYKMLQWVDENAVRQLAQHANPAVRKALESFILCVRYPWKKAVRGYIDDSVRCQSSESAPYKTDAHVPVSHRAVLNLLVSWNSYLYQTCVHHFQELWALNRCSFENGVLLACCVSDYKTYLTMKSLRKIVPRRKMSLKSYPENFLRSSESPGIEILQQSALMPNLYELDCWLDGPRGAVNALPPSMRHLPEGVAELVLHCKQYKERAGERLSSYLRKVVPGDVENKAGALGRAPQYYVRMRKWTSGTNHPGDKDFIDLLFCSPLCRGLQSMTYLRPELPRSADRVSFRGQTVSAYPF